jgi:DNA-binding transcriptional regulator YiaG
MSSRKSRSTAAGREIIDALTDVVEHVEGGGRIEEKYTLRTVELDFVARDYGPEEVKSLRKRLRMSQGLFAGFLGVPVRTLQAWEQGVREVPKIGRRFMDELSQQVDKDANFGVTRIRQAANNLR